MARAKPTSSKKRQVAKKPHGKARKAHPRRKQGGRAGKGKGGRSPNYDWSVLREEFVRAKREEEQAVTLEWFAKEKGIPAPMLRLRAGREKWIERRTQFRDRVHALTRDKAVEKMAQQAAEQDEKDFDFATGIINLGDRKVKSLEKPGKEIRASDLDRMASAGERAQRMHRIAAGRSLPSEGGQQVNVNVLQGGVDPMERIRNKFEACRDAGMDVEQTVQGFCQRVVQDLLGPDYVVELKRRKALKGNQ